LEKAMSTTESEMAMCNCSTFFLSDLHHPECQIFSVTGLEVRARRIAAIKMGLIKDVEGQNLPDDLWRQCLPDAEKEAKRERGRGSPRAFL
jgi:hypothetical protein